MLSPLARELRAQRRRVGAPAGSAPREPPSSLWAPRPLALERSARVVARLAAIEREHPRLHARLGRLDPAQLDAVLCDDPAVLVRAQVGSGKTTVLVHRVLYLHVGAGVPFDEMAVLTFTNRAAAEIRARIIAALDDDHVAFDPDHLWLVGTFHGVARTLLARVLPVERLGRRRDFELLDEDARAALLDEITQANRLRILHRRRLGKRLRCLATGTVTGPERDDLVRLVELYGTEKRTRNLMDFDDLIVNAATLLAHREGAPPRAVVVDEMQDCEPRELDFLRALRGPATAFFAVGDPQQAIYGWRGSGLAAFASAERDLGCRTLGLPFNYRSTRTIVDAARLVLGSQPVSAGPLVATRAAGAPISVRRHQDAVSEAIYLEARLDELHRAGVAYRSIAVLCRLRAQLDALERVLTSHGVPWIDTDDPERDAVRLLTLHGAKGLEFEHVFLSGINRGVLPLGGRAGADDAEERRLLFVGLTRARDHVEISYHARPEHHSAVGEPSPYLRSWPAGMILRHDESLAVAPVTAPESRACNWSAGQAVRHPRYGAGSIVRVDDGNVHCDFGKLGRRSFPEKLCPLVPA